MKAFRFAEILEKAINEVREDHGIRDKIEVVPCDVVQILSNGRHKDVVSGKFVK